MSLKTDAIQSKVVFRTTATITIISLMLIFTVQTFGSEPELNDFFKTIDNYIEYALLHNPGIKAAMDAIEAQKKQAKIVASWPDPMAMVSGKIGSGSTIDGIGISQEVMFPTKLFTEKKAAQQLVSKKETDLILQKADIVEQIRKIYADLYKTGQIIKFQKETLELLKQMESVARVNYASANTSQGSLLKIQVEQAMLDDEIRSMELHGQSLGKALAPLMAIDPRTQFTFPDSLPTNDMQFSQPELMHKIIKQNPVLAGMGKEVDAAGTMVKLAKSQFLPDFSVTAEYMTNRSTSMGLGAGGSGEWNIGVSMSIPVWVGKNLKQIGRAKDMQSEMEHKRENMKNTLLSEVSEMYNEYSDSQRKITLFREVLIPQAKQVLSLMQTGYSTAMIPVIEFLDAQRTLLNLRMKLAQEEARKEHALASICASLGNTSTPGLEANNE